MSHNQNQHGGKRTGAGRKSGWASGCSKDETKSVRIPKKIADKIISFAHIEDLAESTKSFDITSLPSVLLENKDRLPDASAIYFVLSQQNKILYIGQSKALNKRWKHHQKLKDISKYESVKIAYLVFSIPDFLFEIEQALIRHFDPPLNLYNPFNQKSDEVRVVKSLRASDEVWEKLGILAKEKNMTRADYLHWRIEEEEKITKGRKILEDALKLKANAGGAIKKKIRKYLEMK